MKKSNMGTIIGSSRRDRFLIILFQLYGSKTARVIYSGWFLYLLQNLKHFNEILRKNVTYDDVKSD